MNEDIEKRRRVLHSMKHRINKQINHMIEAPVIYPFNDIFGVIISHKDTDGNWEKNRLTCKIITETIINNKQLCQKNKKK